MTIAAAASNRKSYTGNGVTTTFSYNFAFTAQADLVVLVNGVTQVLSSNYTISGSTDSIGRYLSGANVVFTSAPANAASIVIYADPTVQQVIDLTPNDNLPAETVEMGFDRLTLMVRRLKDRVDRAFGLSDSDTSTASLTLPSPSGSSLLGWNSAGTALQNYSSSTLSSALTTAWSLTLLVCSSVGAALDNLFGAVISPTALSGNTDDWNPTGLTTASMVRLSASAAYNLTGIAAPADRRLLTLHNIGSFTITLKDSVTSSAANQFKLNGSDYSLAAGTSVILQYDLTSAKWRLFGQQSSSGGSGGSNSIQDFRLTLTSATPVTTADVATATTIYASPYKGNRIALYDGSSTWNIRTSAEFSLALGTLTSGLPYDVFCYDNSGTPTLEFLAWTSTTTRATALVYQDGVLVKSGATTRRYLGTFYTISTTQTCDSKSAGRYLWNYYNRVNRQAQGTFSVDRSTTSASLTEINTEIQCKFVLGVQEDAVFASVCGTCDGSSTANGIGTSVAFDSTTTAAVGISTNTQTFSAGNNPNPCGVSGSSFLTAGSHYGTLLGKTQTGTATWHSSATASKEKVYLNVGIMA